MVHTSGLGFLFHSSIHLLFHSSIHLRMSALSSVTLRWAEQHGLRAVSSANHRSTSLTQDAPVGVKCRRKHRWRSRYFRTASVLWVGVVIADQVELEAVMDSGAVNALKAIITAIRAA